MDSVEITNDKIVRSKKTLEYPKVSMAEFVYEKLRNVDQQLIALVIFEKIFKLEFPG